MLASHLESRCRSNVFYNHLLLLPLLRLFQSPSNLHTRTQKKTRVSLFASILCLNVWLAHFS